MKTTKRILSLLLALAMVLSLLPSIAFADPEEEQQQEQQGNTNVSVTGQNGTGGLNDPGIGGGDLGGGTTVNGTGENPINQPGEGSDFPGAPASTDVAQINNGAKYETFEAAWNAAAKGDTITLLTDVEVRGNLNKNITINGDRHKITLSGDVTQGNGYCLFFKDVILDLNGHTYNNTNTERYKFRVESGTTIILDSSNTSAGKIDGEQLYVGGTGELKIQSGRVNAEIKSWGGKVEVSGGNVNILNSQNNTPGTVVKVTGGQLNKLYMNAGEATISGGTIINDCWTGNATTKITGTAMLQCTARINNGGTLNVTDGTIAGGNKYAISSDGPNTINISGGTLTSNTYAIVFYGPGEGSDSTATLNITGGSITGCPAISGDGSDFKPADGKSDHGGTVINISGGTIRGTADDGAAIYHPQAGVLNISKTASITGVTGIEMRDGTLNVSGGTITATGNTTSSTGNDRGPTTIGAGIAVAQHTTKKPITVSVTGGTISGYTPFVEVNPQGNSEEDLARITLSISGGTFTTTNGGTQAVYSENKTSFITGGTFNREPTEKYIDAGYYAKDNGDETYTVSKIEYTYTESEQTAGEVTIAADDVQQAVVVTVQQGDGVTVESTGVVAALNDAEPFNANATVRVYVDVDETSTEPAENSITYSVAAMAEITVGSDATTLTLRNNQLGENPSFTFRLDVTALGVAVGGYVKATHKSEGHADEVKTYVVKEDATDNTKYIEVTTSYFSTWTLEGIDTTGKVAAVFDANDVYVESYTTIPDAIDAANAGDTVVLVADVDATGYAKVGNYYNFTINKSITLDGNGHSIKVNSRGIAINQGGNATVNVTIKNLTVNNAVSAGRAISTRGNIGTVTLDNVVMNCTGDGNTQGLTIGGNQATAQTINLVNGTEIHAGNSGYCVITFNPVIMNITDSTLDGWASLNIKGVDGSEGSHGSVFTVSNSVLTSKNVHEGDTNSFALVKVEDDDVTINFGEGNTVTINGQANAQAIVAAESLDTDHGTIGQIDNCVVNITGGDITMTGAASFAIVNSEDDAAVNISDGTFTLPESQQFEATNATIAVSGGSFSAAVPLEYCADGYIPTPQNPETDMYSVGGGSYVAVIGNETDGYTGYTSLYAAVADAEAGETITLVAAVDLDETVILTKNVTIDLNGNNITATDCRALWVKSGDVTITGTGTISANGDDLAATSSVIRVGDSAANNAAAKLTVNAGVTVSSAKSYGVTVFGKNDADDAATTADIEFVLKGTVAVTGAESAISGNGTNSLAIADVTIDTGATVSATQTYAIYHPDRGTLTVDGTVTGGLETKSGTVVINEHAVITASSAALSQSPNGDGTSTTGYAIAAVSNTGYVGAPTVTINGGTITGTTTTLADGAAENEGNVTATAQVTTDANHKWVETAGTYKLVEKVFVAQIGDVKYETLAEAVADATTGTIYLLKDSSGAGIFVGESAGKNITIDFQGYTYTIGGPAVGSPGYESQAFHLEKNNTIVMKDGTITATSNAGVAMLIQNYSNLTLKNMTLDGTQLPGSSNYVLSTNNGTTVIDGTTITANDDDIAFDACSGWGSYQSNSVEVKGNSTINGDVEVSYYGQTGTAPATLTLTSGTISGDIVMEEGAEECTVTKAAGFTQDAPEDYKWVDDGTGVSTLAKKEYVAEVDGVKYESLAAAIAVADGKTVTLLANVTGSVTIPAGKTITLNLAGHTITETTECGVYVFGTLTINDTVGGGGVTAQEMAILIPDGGTLTINAGTFTAIDNAVLGTNGSTGRGGNTITVNGGTFVGTIQSTGYVACGIYAANDDTWTLNGGTFNITNGAGIVQRAGEVIIPNDSTVVFNTTGSTTGKVGDSRVVVPCSAIVFDSAAAYPGLEATSTTAVAGGTFNSEADAVTAVVPENSTETYIDVSGGTFSSAVPENCCAPDYIPQENAGGTYGVKVGTYVAEVDGVKYESLEAAVEAAGNDGTIKLLADVDLGTDPLTSGGYAAIAPTGKSITLDLNGKAITGGALDVYGTLTIKDTSGNGSVTGIGHGIWVNAGATLNVEAGTISTNGVGYPVIANPGTVNISGGTITNTAGAGAVYVNNGTLTMTAGAITNTVGASAVYVNNSTLTISGGTVTSTKDDTDAICIGGASTAAISGGTVTGHDWGVTVFDTSVLTVSGTAEIKTSAEEGYAISTTGNEGQNATVNITGGTITGTELGIYQPSGTLNISGGTITGATGVYFKSKNLSITGGTITGNGAKANYNYNGNGANPTGDALVLDNCGYPNGVESYEVSGGTFRSTNAKAVASYANTGSTALGGFISGGAFSTEVPNAYCYEGYVPVTTKNDDGLYEVEVGQTATARMMATLSLKENIDVNFYVYDLSDTEPEHLALYTVEVTYHDTKKTYKLDEVDTVMSGTTKLYHIVAASCKAEEMGDEITIVVKYGNTVIKEIPYSVKTYCVNQIGKSTDQTLVNLCKATLEYGANAQQFFEYKTGSLVNGGIAYQVEEGTTPVAESYNVTAVSAGKGGDPFSKASATLTLTSEIELNFYFKPNDNLGYDAFEYEVKKGSTDITDTSKVVISDYEGWIVVTVKGFKATELNDTIAVTVKLATDKTQSKTITYSPMSYAYRMQTNEQVGELSQALYFYYKAAEAFFAVHP